MRPTSKSVAKGRSNGVPPAPVISKTSGEFADGRPPAELLDLLQALQAVRVGDFSVRMAGDQVGIHGKIADTFNEIVAANQRMAKQLERVGQVVGRDGKTRERVKFGLSSGAWGEVEDS